MMDVEKLSKKPLKNAPVVTENTPIEQASSKKEISLDTGGEISAATPEQTSSPIPFQLIPPFKISAKAKGMAKTVGIDLSSVEEMAPRMNDWAGSVEKRLDFIISAIPQLPIETIKLLKAEAEKQRSEMTQKAPMGAAAPAQGGDLMSMIAQVAPMLLGGGSSGLSEEITKQVVDAGIKQMFAGTRLLEAIQTKIMTDMGVKAVTETIAK